MQPPPWIQAQQAAQQQPVVPAPVVTPASGPPSQEPSKPIVLQNAAVGIGATVATNVLTSGLTGDTDVVKLSALLNVIVQGVKQIPRFNEKLWTIWLLIGLGVALACWAYRDPAHWDLLHFWREGYFEPPAKGLLNGGAAAFQALSNYHGLGATGASPLQPTPFASSVEGRALAVAGGTT